MSATTAKKHFGNHDMQLGELRNARVHVYDTVVHADADASTANNRFCFITETNRFYMGRSNVWIKIESMGAVPTPSDLPNDEAEGSAYVVYEDPLVADGPNIYILHDDVWEPLRDNDYPSDIVTATTTVSLDSSSRLLVKINSAAGEFTITLPQTATPGDKIFFKDIGGVLNTKPVFLDPDELTLDGLSTPLELNRNYQCLTVQFIENNWLVLSDA